MFIGTVEAIQPTILDPWQAAKTPDWKNDPEIIALKKNQSAAALYRLKDLYLKLFFDLAPREKLSIETAATQQQLQQVMNWIVTQGTQVRFKVSQVIRRTQTDDGDTDSGRQKADTKAPGKADNDDSGESNPESVSVWNAAGSCAVAFQTGETYVVYATEDEETDRIETNVCHRTARVTDAGDELAYFFFHRRSGGSAARLEGLVTAEIQQLQQDRFHYKERIGSPVNDVVIELKFRTGVRYSEPDEGGHFVFDGLPPGDYEVSALKERSFPKRLERLAGPKRIRVAKGECATTTLLVLTARDDR